MSTARTPSQRGLERVLSLVLRLYPAGFRRRHGDDLRELLGQTVALGPDARGPLGPGIERQIIGVVGNVLGGGVDPVARPALYLVHTQAPVPSRR